MLGKRMAKIGALTSARIAQCYAVRTRSASMASGGVDAAQVAPQPQVGIAAACFKFIDENNGDIHTDYRGAVENLAA